MLGSAQTKLPPLTLTSWVKGTSSFVEENTLYGGIVVVVMFKFMPIWRQCWSQRWLWQHWCVWWTISQATCYERAAEYQLVRLQLSLWLSATLSPWKKARWLPGYFTIQSAISPIATIAHCSYLKIHLVDEATVAPLLKHLGCFRHSWTGEPWSMWMLSYIFVANSIFGQFYKSGLCSLMVQRLVGISQYGEYRGLWI